MKFNSILFIIVIVVCSIFIVISVLRKRPDLLVDFALRACFGTAAIYLLNLVMGAWGYSIHVGINGATILTNGLLGLPGFLLLYGLSLYYMYG